MSKMVQDRDVVIIVEEWETVGGLLECNFRQA